MRTVGKMRMGLAMSMVAGSCLMAALPGTAVAAPVDTQLDEVMATMDEVKILDVVKVLDLGDLDLIPDDSATPDAGDEPGDGPDDTTETVPGDSSDETPTVPGDDSSSTPQSNDDTPTIPGDDETPTVPGDEPGDEPGSETDEPGTRTRLPFTGGDPLPFMAIGLTASLAGTGLFLRGRGRAAEASFRDDAETSS